MTGGAEMCEDFLGENLFECSNMFVKHASTNPAQQMSYQKNKHVQ